MDDIVFIKGELQAIRGHMDIYKKNHIDFNKIQVEQTTILHDIATAIKGNEMTNNKGMIHYFEEMQKELKDQHDKQVKYDVYFKLMGGFLMIITGALITAFVKLYTKT
jgi:hypothetical protein